MLGARDEVAKDVWIEKRKVKWCIYQSKMEVYEQFVRKRRIWM